MMMMMMMMRGGGGELPGNDEGRWIKASTMTAM